MTKSPIPSRISRRAFLGIGLAGLAALGAYAAGVEPDQLVLRRVQVPIPNLSPALRGLKIGQFSDPHRCPFVPRSRVERAVALLASEAPDLVALTGDFVSYWPDYAAEYLEILTPFQPRLGLFACLGNHDHWTDPDVVAAALRGAGVTVLRNQHHVLPIGEGKLCLVGVDDMGTSGISLHRTAPADDLPAALAGTEPDGPNATGVLRVLLAHNPDLVMKPDFGAETAARQIHLVLSGHTHGGQVQLPLVGAPFLPSEHGQLFAGGLAQLQGTWIHVSRGVGSSWPVRFNCPPEVNLLTLLPGVDP